MTISTENLSSMCNADLVRLQGENRQRKREIRQRVAALVNSRVAHQIGYEEYSASRNSAKEEATACEQQMAALRTEIARRNR